MYFRWRNKRYNRLAHLINASVVWTLQLEIAFYLFLPLICRVFKGYGVFVLTVSLALVYMHVARHARPESIGFTVVLFLTRFFAFGFGFGTMTAFLKSKCAPKLQALSERRWTPLPVLLLALPVLLGFPAFSIWEFVSLIVAFVFVVFGNDLFGLLSHPALLFLGRSVIASMSHMGLCFSAYPML